MGTGILAFGAYVPRLRLNRKAVAQANGWFNPAVQNLAKGERSFCSWDEDSVTMAVEAARDCLGAFPLVPDAVVFASTTPPFDDRQNAGIVCAALDLPERIGTVDVAGSQRAGSSALIQALAATGQGNTQLLVCSEKRQAKAAGAHELQYGDGAAALLLGDGPAVAEVLAWSRSTVDFVDHFRGRHDPFDYSWEERWVRDEGLMKLVPPVIEDALAQAGMTADQLDRLIVPVPSFALARGVAKAVGVPDGAICDVLQDRLGHCGSAHPLLMLVHELEQLDPGKSVLVTGWGQGCDAILLRTTDRIRSTRPARGLRGAMRRRREETNYARYLAFNRLIEIDKGLRAEVDKQTALSALYRNRRMILGFVGGRCTTCGTAQFPRSQICVNPNCHAVGTQEGYRFADRDAFVLSWTADNLTYTPDPPQHFGMVVFREGGRLMMDFTDVDPGELSTEMGVRLVFRIKDFDERRSFPRYFWKATPDQPIEKEV